jgi:hypothetical protein
MFRRQFRRGMGRVMIDSGLVDEITRATRLLAAGKPDKAAALFTQLAGQMEVLERPRLAGNLHAQAAHAWVEAGVERHALNQARMAMNLFLHLGMNRRAVTFRTNITKHLRERKFDGTAEIIERETDLPELLQPAAAPEIKRGRLPTACPHCGAPVRSDMVEWIDDRSAACDFCNSTINTTD